MPHAVLDGLVGRTGAHPQDTMMVFAELCKDLCLEGRDVLSDAAVRSATDRVLRALDVACGAEWSDLARGRGCRTTLPRAADHRPVHSGLSHAESKAASAALKRLLAEGLIRREGHGRYGLREPLWAGCSGRRPTPEPQSEHAEPSTGAPRGHGA